MESISRVAFEGSGQAGASMISPAIWGAIDVPFFEFDVETAKGLMAEAGLADGFSTVLMYSLYDPQYAMVSQMVQNQLREIGIDVRLQQIEWGAFLDAVYSGEQEMFILSWNTPTGDADYGMYGLSHSANANGGNNLTNYIHPDIDRLLNEGRSSLNEAHRLTVYAELQHLLRNEAAYLFFHYTEQLHVASPAVQGFIVNPIEQHDLWRVTFN
jgi:peptide/nickel transport system substrate-binding protein